MRNFARTHACGDCSGLWRHANSGAHPHEHTASDAHGYAHQRADQYTATQTDEYAGADQYTGADESTSDCRRHQAVCQRDRCTGDRNDQAYERAHGDNCCGDQTHECAHGSRDHWTIRDEYQFDRYCSQGYVLGVPRAV